MSEAKPIASLTPTLLARKGGAKPAMRSQLTPMGHFKDGLARQFDPDDCGWNDHGEEFDAPQAGEHRSADIVPIVDPGLPVQDLVVAPAARAVPAVVQQQRAIAQRVASPRRSAIDDGRRAAFTLRVDPDRHIKLRLACTIRNRSAQQLVTEALDRLLAELPDVGVLAAQLKAQRN